MAHILTQKETETSSVYVMSAKEKCKTCIYKHHDCSSDPDNKCQVTY